MPAGECTLEFLYRPRSFWIGMAVAPASLLLLLGLARWSRYARSATVGSRIHPRNDVPGVLDVAERFAEVIDQELRGLVAAGADLIQIDEPARGNVSGQEMVRLFNRATDGVRAKLAFHICFGNRFGRNRSGQMRHEVIRRRAAPHRRGAHGDHVANRHNVPLLVRGGPPR